MSRFNQSYSSSRSTGDSNLSLATQALHGPLDTLLEGGRRTGPLVGALCQSTTFHQVKLGAHEGPTYSRVDNPTVSELETVLGALEAAPPAVTFGTGLGAEAALFFAVLKAGSHAVIGEAIYGGTTRLFRQLLPELGITATFVDASDPEAVGGAIQPNTRLVFLETPANPTLKLTDIGAIARITKQSNDGTILLVVDNTFLTPVLQRPLDLGADVSVYSTTKLIEGHSTACGGAVVARDLALLERVRWIRKCTGGIQAPFGAWLTTRGLKTLPLRIREQSRNAQVIAEWLRDNPYVSQVNYPGLLDFPQKDLAARQHREGLHGNVVSFEVRGGAVAGKSVLDGAKLCALVEHVGSVETLLTHPVTMTHADVPKEQRVAAGITDGLIRLSVGLEEPEEIIRDLEQAIAKAHTPVAKEPRSPLCVLKLGGSVLRTEADVERATIEIRRWTAKGYKVVAVVSALQGVTDSLVARAEAYGDAGAATSRALLTGTGELSSASLLGLALTRAGVKAEVAAPWQINLRAEGEPLDASPVSVASDDVFSLLRGYDCLVVPGFVALDAQGHLVLLGRGGSDLSALFLAHALEADVCRLVKDVAGLYEYDPKHGSAGRSLPRRYASLSWADSLCLDGGIVQHKAIRAALSWRLSFEVGELLAGDATKVGDLPTVFLKGREERAQAVAASAL